MLKVYVIGYARIVAERYLDITEIFKKVKEHVKREIQQ